MQNVTATRLAPDPPRATLTISLCFLIALLEGFDIQALGIAAPKLMAEFGISRPNFGLIAAFSGIGVVLGAGIGGWLADLFGRKPVLVGSVLTFGVFTMAMIATPNQELLFAARTAAGLGFGAALSIMMAIAAEVSPANKKSFIAALIFCGMPAGGGTCALVARLLPPDSNWRTLFIIGGILPLLLALALHWHLRETLSRTTSEKPPTVNMAQAVFGAGRAVPSLLLWAAFFPTMLILYLLLNWLTSLVTAKQLGAAAAFEAPLAFNYCAVLGALTFGALADRLGARWPLTLCFAALVLTLFALGGADTRTGMVFFSGLAGFFLLGANYALYGIAAAHYPTAIRGTGSGACVAVGRVGAVVGPLLAGLLLGGGATPATVIAYMAPLAAAAGVAVFALSYFRTAES